VGYGGMSSAMSLKLGGKGKKKTSFLDDTGDDSVDPSGAEEVDDMDTSSKGVNASEGEGVELADSGDSEPDIGDEGEGKEMGTYDAVEDDAASELAGIVGVPEDKREAFKSALSDYVAACVRKQGK